MGGVDLMDMLSALYKYSIKSRRWYLYIWFHTLTVALVNAWLLYRRQHPGKKCMKLRDFQVEVAEALVKSGNGKVRGRPSSIISPQPVPKKKRVEPLPGNDVWMDGARTIIHPKARIIAKSGPIVIGENNLIEDQTQIIHKNNSNGPNTSVMIIGNNNVFEVGSYSEAMRIGDNNILEPKAKVGPHVELTNGCSIGALCEISTQEVLPENTVIFGTNCDRRVQSERPAPQNLQLDFLSKILPNYHLIKKHNTSSPTPASGSDPGRKNPLSKVR
ncbi:Dynactin subunit 6 [Nymphon striatum]|nr:Dynactin subunit 6 [Nymphon striatum]